MNAPRVTQFREKDQGAHGTAVRSQPSPSQRPEAVIDALMQSSQNLTQHTYLRAENWKLAGRRQKRFLSFLHSAFCIRHSAICFHVRLPEEVPVPQFEYQKHPDAAGMVAASAQMLLQEPPYSVRPEVASLQGTRLEQWFQQARFQFSPHPMHKWHGK